MARPGPRVLAAAVVALVGGTAFVQLGAPAARPTVTVYKTPT